MKNKNNFAMSKVNDSDGSTFFDIFNYIEPVIMYRLSSQMSYLCELYSTLKHRGLLDYKIQLFLNKPSQNFSHQIQVTIYNDRSQILDVINFGLSFAFEPPASHIMLVNDFFNQVIEGGKL